MHLFTFMYMSLKTIQITIPYDKELNDLITFSPEENILILKIGSSCLLEGRKSVANLTQKELYQKIQNDFKEEIQELEMKIYCEKELSKKNNEQINK